ncbi:MAG: serine hydrolase [Bacteroidetes bacterium]|nr:serine hydrolase [Bacteroidota bacterium]
MRKFCFSFFLIITITIPSLSRVLAQSNSLNLKEKHWVDSVYKSLSLEQKIGQLIIVRANEAGKAYDGNIEKYIKDYNIGGVTFFRFDALKQIEHTNQWQSIAQTPLFISMDAEWGVAMRLNEFIKFPYQMTLGAIQNDSLIYKMGTEVARQCRRLGIQMNFAPVVDININPNNPVINMRSFGEDKYNVTRKGLMYMKGLQDNGIIATAKHFPGHGDTDTDSHASLPIINQSRERLDSIELYPFKELFKNDLGGIMIAHLYIPAYENAENTASTLSHNVVTKLLRDELGFKGLVVTDALDMSGVTKYFKPGIIEQKALEAGNDILLLPKEVPTAMRILKKAVEDGEIPESRIEESCKKILAYKFKAGLNNPYSINPNYLLEDINNADANYLNQELYESALTLVKNIDSLLPLKRLDTLKIASIGIGVGASTKFQERLNNYAPIKHFYLNKESSLEEQQAILSELEQFNLVIVAIQNTGIYPANKFGISPSTFTFVDSLLKSKNIILDLFSNPYALSLFKNDDRFKSILVSYEDNEFTYDLSAQLIFGGVAAKGKLPVTVSPFFSINTGIETVANRIKFGRPEELNINYNYLKKVDSIAMLGIAKKAYPGCQIIALKDGVVFYNKAFGNQTYSGTIPVKLTDLYDIASITKIAATTISVMKMQENGQIDIDRKLSEYLPYLKKSNKGDIVLRDLLTHQAQFQAWIPYFQSTLTENKLDTSVYHTSISELYPIRVAENIYIRDNYKYHIVDSILLSPLREKNDYKYSDLGFYLLAAAIESINNQPMNQYVDEHFYKPLGLSNISYLPRRKYALSRIIPTELDTMFRHQLVHGDVHDPGAAMLGGVSGHAGLFSNATDLAVIMQMLLQKGSYGGQQYFTQQTINDFTKYQFPLNENRRGLGFDKPLLEYVKGGAVSFSASADSFGHSGFTGTYAWADPQHGLVYVFLSNRIHPDAANSKIMDLNIRTEIHEAFYHAINKTKTIKN